MEINRTSSALVVSEIDTIIADLLRQAPAAADASGSDRAQERLFSKPTAGADPALDQDWTELVQPELTQLFQSAVDTVRADVAAMTELDVGGVREFTLRIPLKHLERWLNALNQARLVLAARHGFSDTELASDSLPYEIDSERGMALFQIHFYGVLQEVIVRELT